MMWVNLRKYFTWFVSALIAATKVSWSPESFLNPIQDGVFWGCSRMRGQKPRLLTDEGGGRQKTPLLKICHTYPTMIKLLGTVISYLKKIQKNIWITWHTLWVLLMSAFFTENQQILLYQKMQILYFDT